MLDKIILYKYFLFQGKIKPADLKWAVKYHKKHRIECGRFWCWHDWHCFEVIPSGHAEYGFVQTDVICDKCGRVSRRRPNHIDDRLIDYSRRMVLM